MRETQGEREKKRERVGEREEKGSETDFMSFEAKSNKALSQTLNIFY